MHPNLLWAHLFDFGAVGGEEGGAVVNPVLGDVVAMGGPVAGGGGNGGGE
jgi:hypothetical protein